MRRETVIASLLCLNLALAATLALVWKHRLHLVQSTEALGTDSASTARAVPSVSKPPSSSPSPPSEFSWRILQASNYKQYIVNLRAVGCPELTIQDIIVAAVNRQYAAREAALNLRPELAKPWEIAGWSGAGYYDKQRQMREL